MSPYVSWILLAIALLADVFSLIGAVRDAKPESRGRRLAWASALVVLTGMVVYQGIAIQNISGVKNEAQALVNRWPRSDKLIFSTKGELIGTVLSGLQFLERHRSEYPETFAAAQALVHNRLGDFRAPADLEKDLAEYGPLRDGAGAMIQLVQSIANDS